MMISIFRGGEEFVKVPIEYGSKAKKELMTEDSITLNFSSDNSYKFLVGDYINDPRFGYYILTNDYLPNHKENTAGYDYSIKFDSYYYAWNNHFVKLFSKVSESDTISELSFSSTQDISSHVDIILNNLSHLGFKYQESNFIAIIGEDVTTERKVITYDNVHIIDAMTMIAETFECEWWVTDNVIHFGRCEYAGNFDFKLGDTVSTMAPTDSSEEVGTRLYVFGSERNLPQGYRKSSEDSYAIVQKRLMLPVGIPYLEKKKGLDNSQVIEFVKIFDIFPKVDCKISSVVSEKITATNDGETTEEMRYYITDENIKFSKEYLLDEDLTIRFTSGSLRGMDFALDFNPYNKDENTKEGQVFKIIPNENYGPLLPNEVLFPKLSDEFVLLNWDSSKIADLGLIDKAEQELLKAGEEYLKDLDTDGKVYTSAMRSHIAMQMYDGNIKSLLDVGDSVTLINDVYFSSGARKSRIIGYEFNLDVPYDNPVYTVGEKPKYTRLKTLEENIEKVIYSGEVEKNFGTGNVYVISRNDETLPSDRNVYSSLRSELEFLKKNKEDIAKEVITFEKGLVSKMTAFFEAISSKRYVSGLTGEGFLMEYKDGISSLEIDKLTVRQIMTVFELLIQKIRSVGGQIAVSSANGKIKSIEDKGESYLIVFEDDNLFKENDLIRCQTFTGSSVKMYWVEVSESDAKGVLVNKSEFEGIEPMPGDECVLDGNTTDKTRQNMILISATEDGQPRIDIFNGIATKSHDNCLRARLGNLDGIYDELFGENQPKGDGLYSDNAYLKGEFIVKSRNESVGTMFAVQEGKIKSLVGQTQTLAAQGGFLRNPSFAEGLKYWQTNNQATTVFSLGMPVFTNGEMLVNGIDDNVRGKYDEEKFFVTLKNGFIKQLNDYFVNKPTFEDFEGKKIPVNVSFKIRVKTIGKLTVKVGDNIIVDETRGAADNFIEVKGDGEWVGNEHFTLNFSGEADLTDLSLYTDELALKTETLIEQTDKYVNILAKNFDEEGNVKSESGLMVKPNEAGLYAQDENGEQTKIAAYEDGKILLKGDHIQLEGDISANGNVSIDSKTGDLTANNATLNNGTFSGKVTANSGNIGSLDIDDEADGGLKYENFKINKKGLYAERVIGYTGFDDIAYNKFELKYESAESQDAVVEVRRKRFVDYDYNTGEIVNDYNPSMLVANDSSYSGVALRVQGALQLQGGFVNYIKVVNFVGTESNNSKLIPILDSSFFYLYSDRSNGDAWFLLPQFNELRKMLSIPEGESFGITFNIMNDMWGNNINLSFNGDNSSVIYNSAGTAIGNSLTISKGDSYKILVRGTAAGYWMVAINYHD